MSRQESAISGNFAAHPGDAVENSSARSLNNGLISDGDPCFFESVGGKRGRPENMTFPSNEPIGTIVKIICPPSNKRARLNGAGSSSSVSSSSSAVADDTSVVSKDVAELMRMYPWLANKANPEDISRLLSRSQLISIAHYLYNYGTRLDIDNALFDKSCARQNYAKFLHQEWTNQQRSCALDRSSQVWKMLN